MGHKLENLETCIMAIHNTIATVVEVSKVYETPAWGFEGDVFYNCAITIHSHKSAQKILGKIIQLEKKLGRIRTNSEQYESRSIDIDILFYEDNQVITEALTVPHPHMHERVFVLKPVCDIVPDFFHPVLKVTMKNLLRELVDDSTLFCN